jgi:endonuclease YncB( thermonuclease family)
MLRSITTATCLAASILPAPAQQPPDGACGGEIIGTVSVASVIDGRTFRTTDGREVRLAGIETPGRNMALGALIAGKAVTLKKSGEDRYGRVVAYAYAGDDLIQRQLVQAGEAYVAARAGSNPCAGGLFAAERAARAAGRGVWADPELRPKSAANRDEILRVQGHFAVVEGQVLNVRESGGTIYLNFGRYYTRDFSVRVPRRSAARFASSLKLLQGKHVRVRGVVETGRGPLIEASRPEQIELIE